MCLAFGGDGSLQVCSLAACVGNSCRNQAGKTLVNGLHCLCGLAFQTIGRICWVPEQSGSLRPQFGNLCDDIPIVEIPTLTPACEGCF